MDVFQAAYRTAHDFDGGASKGGGAVKLAIRMGYNPGTFLNRVNPEQEDHKLWLGDAVLMQVVSGDHRILHTMAGTLGEVCFPIPDLTNVSDAALIELICKVGTEGGHFYEVINSGLTQTRFTRGDYERIRQEGLEFIAAIAETMARIDGMLDE